jgi:hypothetical protein
MKTATLPIPRILAKGEILRIPQAAGTRVVCLHGSVWVTEDADTRDLVLGHDEVVTLSQRGRALVFALEPASVLLEQPTPARRPPSLFSRLSRASDWLAARWVYPVRTMASWS